MRIWIDKGKLIHHVNAAVLAGDFDHEVDYHLEFQLIDGNGKDAKGSYRGTGTIQTISGHKVLTLGDPYRDATLTDYVICDKPTPESDRKLDQFVAGLKKGMDKKSRLPKSYSYEWRQGFDEGRKLK